MFYYSKTPYICSKFKHFAEIIFFKLFKDFIMNKGDLINKIASDAGITKTQAQSALNSFMHSAHTCLKKGDKLTLVGFGTFSTTKRSARKGRKSTDRERNQHSGKESGKIQGRKGIIYFYQVISTKITKPSSPYGNEGFLFKYYLTDYL